MILVVILTPNINIHIWGFNYFYYLIDYVIIRLTNFGYDINKKKDCWIYQTNKKLIIKNSISIK